MPSAETGRMPVAFSAVSASPAHFCRLIHSETVSFFLAAFLIYARTVAPNVLFGDSGEFQVISATGGLAHASGYPIYLALGKLSVAREHAGPPAP